MDNEIKSALHLKPSLLTQGFMQYTMYFGKVKFRSAVASWGSINHSHVSKTGISVFWVRINILILHFIVEENGHENLCMCRQVFTLQKHKSIYKLQDFLQGHNYCVRNISLSWLFISKPSALRFFIFMSSTVCKFSTQLFKTIFSFQKEWYWRMWLGNVFFCW